MSWDAYVQSLAGQGVTTSAICGLQGGVWAATPGFAPSDAEITKIVSNLGQPNGGDSAANGVHVAGVKYMFLRVIGDDNMLGKKAATGVCIAKSEQALVIGLYGEGGSSEVTNKAVTGMAEYLKSSGY